MKKKVRSAEERSALFFMFLCAAVYFTSYVTRINYKAVLVNVTSDLGVEDTAAGLVSLAMFLTYGIGQLISGFIGDKIKPRLLLVIGMSVTALCNLSMPFFTDTVPMIAVWGINGFAQALFWPPMVRMMADNLSELNYNRACIWVSVASSIATIVIYLISSLCVAVFNWRAVFYISAAIAVAMAVIWQITAPKKALKPENASAEVTNNAAAPKLKIGKTVILIMIPVLSAIIIQGILKDGIDTWLPTLFSNAFSLPDESAILSSIILPIFTIISYNVSHRIEHRIGNELKTSALFYLTASIASLLLALIPNPHFVITMILFAVIVACMHGVNLMLISRVPRYFDKYGKISTVSGLVNAFTYVGSALAMWLIPSVSSKWGWELQVISVFSVIMAGLGALICLLIIKPWKKFRKSR